MKLLRQESWLENKRIGLKSAMHHQQLDVARWNVLHSARAGLTTMEHWYGLPEALFTDRTIQNFRLDYNYQNEQHRFAEAGKLWQQAAPPFSEHWNKVMNELIELDFTLDPTLNIYEANRDLMRARTQEWHGVYTLPSLWRFYAPNRQSHGSYWFDWTTEEEVLWKDKEENPLQNLKVLYGTGAVRVNDSNEPVRVGGVKYTVKDGIVYDAKKLLQDVRTIVDQHKARENARITQPGLDW